MFYTAKSTITSTFQSLPSRTFYTFYMFYTAKPKSRALT